jgi:hypothetical protein
MIVILSLEKGSSLCLKQQLLLVRVHGSLHHGVGKLLHHAWYLVHEHALLKGLHLESQLLLLLKAHEVANLRLVINICVVDSVAIALIY